jgi:NAD+ synthase (glutamine-hydrolysing)
MSQMAKVRLSTHQWHHTIADFDNIFHSLAQLSATHQSPADEYHIHLFSEMVLAGYPLQDLILQKSFIQRYHAHLDKIHQHFLALPQDPRTLYLLGGPIYHFDDFGLVKKIHNGAFQAIPGIGIKPIYHKMLLPNYDIFDEKKYFTAGDAPCLLEWNGLKLAILICEDMWASTTHNVDPVAELRNYCQLNKTTPHLFLNLSASPYHTGKQEKRLARASEISNIFGSIPFAYCNRVGSEDEIIFDGQSFIVQGDSVLQQSTIFDEQSSSYDFDFSQLIAAASKHSNQTITKKNNQDNTWEAVYSPRLGKKLDRLRPMSDPECAEVIEALQFGLQEYARKCGMKNFLIALSGGIDSGLVLTIAQRMLKQDQQIEAIYMPGQYSASLSWDLCQSICQKIKVPLKSFNIKFLHGVFRNGFQDQIGNKLEGLADENIQSRMRGTILYARSNQTGSLVINTSNKSEIAVGYSTLYGDSVGAISLLGDLYKTEVYQLCDYINRHWDNPIPQDMITRPPSAELRDNQTDQDSLPPYPEMDAILEGLISYRYSQEELIKFGHNANYVTKVFKLYQLAEYKRFQFCPILKVRSKSFGFGYRVPIAKKLFTLVDK